MARGGYTPIHHYTALPAQARPQTGGPAPPETSRRPCRHAAGGGGAPNGLVFSGCGHPSRTQGVPAQTRAAPSMRCPLHWLVHYL
jgi:hypothetical protein